MNETKFYFVVIFACAITAGAICASIGFANQSYESNRAYESAKSRIAELENTNLDAISRAERAEEGIRELRDENTRIANELGSLKDKLRSSIDRINRIESQARTIEEIIERIESIIGEFEQLIKDI